jgi:cell wall-associated NlpC family hydrolase
MLGLSARDQKELRRVVLRTAYVGVKLEPIVHYTEGPLRWSGISMQRRSWENEAPPYADCASFVTWVYWDASRWLRLGDFLNGAGWAAGYTGTLTQHGVQVDTLAPGDLVFYGDLSIPYHVALYVGNGRVISHGGEQGPEVVAVGPATQYRRYV